MAFWRHAALTVLVLAGLGLPPERAAAETFEVTITEWCPYMCTAGERRGFTTDIVDAAFASQGHEVRFRILPWLRALDLTRRGETDGALAPAKAEAPDFLFPDSPVSHQQMCFFTAADHDWHYDGMASLQAIRFGFLANLSLPGIMNYISILEGTDRVQPIADDQFMTKNFKKIDSGRLEALIDDRNVVDHYMKQRGIAPGTYRLAGCLADEPIYLGFSPALPEKAGRMGAIYERGIRAIRDSGELDRILNSYGTPDAAPSM